MALLKITDATGREWQYELPPDALCTIGRAPDNSVTLNDPLVSRYHAHIKHAAGRFVIVDGALVSGALKRSVNKVFVNGQARAEHPLADGDLIAIGKSLLLFEQPKADLAASLGYDDTRMGRTQVTVGAREVIRQALTARTGARATDEELAALQRKAEILALLYELSQTLGSVFDLETIFDKATDIVFRVTPADRVVALLNTGAPAPGADEPELRPIALRARDERLLLEARNMTIGRTITRRVMRERVALLSQDAAAEAEFAQVKSIIAQGVRSTICAPLVTESGVHGALYADRLDPDKQFTRDDLELICAIAAQAAVAVETVRAHERIKREEVTRANYSRFLPDYVVRQLLEHPDSFRLGDGVTQTLTVLFADVRGFTRLAEHTAPEQVVQLLNNYFSVMTKVIFEHGGTLDKYIGDGLMALFGAPAATPEDAARAVATAVAMQRELGAVNAQLRAAGLPEISIGIGLHTGEATVGYIGSERRTEYTAIGDTVNLAARLEQNAAGGQILISEEAARAAGDTPYPLRPRPALNVKNRVQPVPVFEVLWPHDAQAGPLPT